MGSESQGGEQYARVSDAPRSKLRTSVAGVLCEGEHDDGPEVVGGVRRRRHWRRGCPRLGRHGSGPGASGQAQEAGWEPLVVRARRRVGDVEAVAAGEEEAHGAGGGAVGIAGIARSRRVVYWCWELGREQEVGEEERPKGVRRGGVGSRPFLGCARRFRDLWRLMVGDGDDGAVAD